MRYLRACSVGELEEDTPMRVVLEGVPVSVVRTEGEFYAVHDICSHANVSLSGGDVTDRTIGCWLHTSSFDLRTGRPTSPPATEPIAVYPVKVDGDDVLVSITSGEREL
ncbi:non-heme iron oxygenase ferredoxin subunit [Streptomyces sp. KLMMK]|uniref:non-heme iron oxygenase ferredoxin subunit n=1 Tax=Streptomyces sp. KLMMK TaxID=3109353 RepID=UPI00300829B2